MKTEIESYLQKTVTELRRKLNESESQIQSLKELSNSQESLISLMKEYIRVTLGEDKYNQLFNKEAA
jgi:translation initiation factor 2B subunit (eIF-2B alpha/beta/delta family)